MSWPTVELGSLSRVDYGVTASATTEPSGPKFLRITDIQDGSVNWNAVPYCECSDRERKTSKLQMGDIVFARTGATTGKSFLIKDEPGDAVFASYLIRVQPSAKILPQFVAHYFNSSSYWSQITRHARGAGQPGVNATSLKSLQIPLPPLDEQRRIAAILDRAEELRAKRRAAIALLDQLPQAIFFNIFGDPATNPKSWPVRELSDVVKEGTIVTYGIVQAGEEYPSGVPYIRTGDIVDGEIKLKGLRHTDPKIASKFQRSQVDKGDIVMSIRATVGTVALVPESLDGANLTQGTARISPGSAIDGLYLYEFLRSLATQHWLNLQVKGATFREITLARLRQLPVLLPPLVLQSEYASRLKALNRAKAAHQSALTQLDTLFAALQDQAFRGSSTIERELVDV